MDDAPRIHEIALDEVALAHLSQAQWIRHSTLQKSRSKREPGNPTSTLNHVVTESAGW